MSPRRRAVESWALAVTVAVVATLVVGAPRRLTALEPPQTSQPAEAVTSSTGVGWEFDQVIQAVQPLLYYGGKRKSGIFSYFDSTETQPPVPLNVDMNWNFDDTPASIRNKMFNREQFFVRFLQRAGTVYYHTFVNTNARPGGGDFLIHQFWYYFPTGDARYVGSADQGFSLVELEQIVPRGPDEIEKLRGVVVADLEGHRAKLDASIAAAKGRSPEEVAVFERYQASIDAILSRPVEIPLNYYLERIYTTSAMYPDDSESPRIVVYQRDQLRWAKTRPVVYVAEGTHNLVGRTADLAKGDCCDAPYIIHANLRERIINLHNPHEEYNPFPAGTNPHQIELGGVFVEHPLYWLGARRYLAKLAAGEPLIGVKVRWRNEEEKGR